MPVCACVCVSYIHDVRVGSALVGLVVFGVFEQNFVHVSAGVLKQFVGAVEDDEGDLTVTQHAQLVRLLHQTKLTLCERHLQESEKVRWRKVWLRHSCSLQDKLV